MHRVRRRRIPEGATALVTGAGSGLGRALAERLARERRARLVLTDVDEQRLEQTAESVRRLGGESHSVGADVASWSDWKRVADEAQQFLERPLDVMILNAGVASVGEVGQVPLEDWEWQLRVNLWGAIYGCHLFAGPMKARGRGWILTVASAAAFASAPRMAPYNVSKAALVSLTETLDQEVRPQGIQVTVTCPTFFRSRLADNVRTQAPDLARITEKVLQRARWSAEDVARAALAGLERGDLYVIPQGDAQALWLAKRALGRRYRQLFAWADFMARRRKDLIRLP